MRIQTPLARARHLGSAMEGPEHWWMQRMTSLMLIPLTLWFVASMWWLGVGGATYEAFQDWLSGPISAVLMLLFVGATFYHLKLGMQVIAEDYIISKVARWGFIIMIALGCMTGAVAALYAVVAVAIGG